ncbi:MAG: AAA family ATPase [Deltaproteobacteria bacterium]
MVGRQTELTQLTSWLDAAIAGRGGLGLLSGPAGIGKTALLQSLSERARGRDMAVAWGSVETGMRSRPPWPWPTILRRLGHPRCRQLADELVAMIPPRTPAHAPLGGAGERPVDQMLNQIIDVLTEAACERPQLIVLDRAQDLDPTSIDFLRLFSDSTEHLPLLIIAATRPTGDTTQQELAFAAGDRTLEVQPLGPLAIARILGKATTAELGGDATALRITAGVPLIALTLRGTAAKHFRPRETDTIRERIVELVGTQLAQLDPALRGLIEACAVCDGAVELSLLARILDAEIDTIERWLERSEVKRFIERERTEESDLLELPHRLLGDAVRAGTDPGDRRSLHARFAAEWIERAARGILVAPETIAYHACRGVPILPAAVAAEWACHAAGNANFVGSHSTAQSWVRSGTQALDISAAPSDQQVRLDLQVEMFVATLGKAPTESIRHLDAIQSLATQLGPAALGNAGFSIVDTADLAYSDAATLTAVVNLLDTAIVAQPSATARYAGLLSSKAFVLGHLGNVEGARQAAKAAFDASEAQAKDCASRPGAALARLRFDPFGQTLPERIELALGLSVKEGDSRGHATAGLARGHAMVDQFALGAVPEATALLAQIEAGVAQTPEHPLSWYPHHLRAVRAVMCLEVEPARDALEASLAAAATPASTMVAYSAAMVLLGQWHEFTGDWLDIDGLVAPEETTRRRVRTITVESIRGPIEIVGAPNRALEAALLKDRAAGDAASAVYAELTLRARDGFRDIPIDASWIPTLGLLAEASALLAHRASAAVLREQLRPYESRFIVAPHAIAVSGIVAGYLAPLAAMLDEPDEAEQLARLAIDENDRVGLPFYATRARLDLADTLRARGSTEDQSEANTLVVTARSTIDRLGMAGLRARLATLDADTPPSPQATLITVAPAAAGLWRRGDVWIIRWESQEIHLRNQRGLAFLHALVERPGEAIHVRELMLLGKTAPASKRGVAELRSGEMHSTSGEGLPVLDEQALSAYRSRLREIGEDLAQAEEESDLGRAEVLRAEQDALLEEVKGATGLGGRRRKTGSDVERARVAVRKRLKSVLERLRRELPPLHLHFNASLRTGTFCCYEPEVSRVWTTTDPNGI